MWITDLSHVSFLYSLLATAAYNVSNSPYYKILPLPRKFDFGKLTVFQNHISVNVVHCKKKDYQIAFWFRSIHSLPKVTQSRQSSSHPDPCWTQLNEFSTVGRFISHPNSVVSVVVKISVNLNCARSQSIISLWVTAEQEVAPRKAQK